MRPQVTETSLMAYERLKREKRLSKNKRKVMDLLMSTMGRTWTGNEVNAALKLPNQVSPGFHKRLSELVDDGLIINVGSRQCFVTGEVAVHYAVAQFYSPQLSFVFKPKTPTKAEFRAAYGTLSMLLQQQNAFGMDVGEATEKVVAWLHSKGKK